MDPLQIPGAETPVRRSPSPIIPGAWPLTPPTFKGASLTYRGEISGAQFDVPPPSLENVTGAMTSSPSHETLDSLPAIFSSSTFDSIPSENSQATRLTRDTLASTSTLGNTSFDAFNALTSTPERSSTSKISIQPSESKASFPLLGRNYSGGIPDMYPSSPQIILHKPLPASTPRREDPNTCQIGRPPYPRLAIPCDNPPADVGPSPPRPAGPSTQGGEVSISPISFASPTSSQGFTSSDRGRNSYDYNISPSWDTSYESEYNSQHIRTSSHTHSLPPLVLPLSRLSTNDGQALLDHTPSVDVDLHGLQMLTTLSLPSSDHDSSTHETGNNTEPSRFLDHETPWTLSLSPQLTPLSNSIECASPMSQSQSLSPTSSFGAEIGLGPGEPRFITFPSSPFVSELPSPAYEDAGPNNQPDHLNAADYAAAFMSSTWNTGGERIPEVLEAYGDVDSGASVEACASSGDPLEHAHVYETTKLAAVIGKVKRLGGKVKKLLTPRLGTGRKARRASGIGYEIPTSQSGLTPIDGPRHVISRPDSSLGMNGDEISSNATTALPLPPGLLFRPSLTTQTYTRASATSSQNDNNVVGIQPPAIHICPPGSPGPSQARKSLGPENKELFKRSSESKPRLRPKTLSEIKSKRPLSLSALSTPSRPSLSAPRTIAISRPRPRSSIVSPASDLLVEEPALFINSAQRASQIPELAYTPPTDLVLRQVPQIETPFPVGSSFKKNRRFSLASLSNFISSR